MKFINIEHKARDWSQPNCPSRQSPSAPALQLDHGKLSTLLLTLAAVKVRSMVCLSAHGTEPREPLECVIRRFSSLVFRFLQTFQDEIRLEEGKGMKTANPGLANGFFLVRTRPVVSSTIHTCGCPLPTERGEDQPGPAAEGGPRCRNPIPDQGPTATTFGASVSSSWQAPRRCRLNALVG